MKKSTMPRSHQSVRYLAHKVLPNFSWHYPMVLRRGRSQLQVLFNIHTESDNSLILSFFQCHSLFLHSFILLFSHPLHSDSFYLFSPSILSFLILSFPLAPFLLPFSIPLILWFSGSIISHSSSHSLIFYDILQFSRSLIILSCSHYQCSSLFHAPILISCSHYLSVHHYFMLPFSFSFSHVRYSALHSQPRFPSLISSFSLLVFNQFLAIRIGSDD